MTLSLAVGLSLASVTWGESGDAGLSEPERRGGWRPLFDGETTKGWRNFRREGISDGWVVEDGVLSRVGRRAGDIITEEQFQYFELTLEYRISPGGNSGLMFHVSEESEAPWHSGPEVQILCNEKGRDPQKSGWLYQLYKPRKPQWAIQFERQAGIESPEVDDATRPAGEWNEIYLRVSAHQSEVALNGVSYYYFRMNDEQWNERVAASKFADMPLFGKTGKGHICLQDHGDLVSFRNIRIRELPESDEVPNPIDAQLPVVGELAFPKLEWAGRQEEEDAGRLRPLRPLVLTHAGDGSNRIFAATQRGKIHVFPNDPEVEMTDVFLDLTEKVHDWQRDNEEGLLGLAFHPKYSENGQLFVYYSSEEEPRTSIVSRFQVSSDDPNRADPESEFVVMKIPQPFANHNGGSIAFGPDGYLYIGLGDGGGRNDPLLTGQDLSTWMGSLLRIDVDQTEEGKRYGIPSDNPFVDREGALPEIYAYGFRNIWRLSFDRETGDLWVADVGQDRWEEINVVKAGGNYGWSLREGSFPFGNTVGNPVDPLLNPVWEYDHMVGKSITGGYVYRGPRPELQGLYLYADYVSGKIWALGLDRETGKVDKNYGISDGGLPVLAFGEDEQGEVYYLLESASGQGIFRFVSR